MNLPMVSVIVPTFNSEETLALCLQSIKDQTYPNIETIMVDRYSSDNTLKIAERFSARVFLMGSERSAARNYGVANAKGLFILFLDSDMELTPRVVEECIAACLRKDSDAVIIPEVSVARVFLSECRKIEKELYESYRGYAEIPRFFRKETFLKIGGFDERLVFGESTDFNSRIQKASCKIVRVKAKVRHHEKNLSWKKFVFEERYYCETLPFLMKKNLSLTMKRHCPLPIGLFYRRNLKMLLLEQPIHLVGLILMELVKYLACLTGIVTYLLSGR